MISPQINVNAANPKAAQEMQTQGYDENGESFKAEEYVRLCNENISPVHTDETDASVNNEKSSSPDQISALTEPSDAEQSFDGDRSLKPSRIPILKTKHLESTNSVSSNDLSNKCPNSVEDHDALKLLNTSCIPTSPVTGKKYRSPLSMQPKLSDRSKKLMNGSVSNNNTSFDSLTSLNTVNSNLVPNLNTESPDATSRSIPSETTPNMNSLVDIKNETNSGRSTPVSINNKSMNDMNSSIIDKYKVTGTNESIHSDRKPRFKWMFGPHKNANVVCFSRYKSQS